MDRWTPRANKLWAAGRAPEVSKHVPGARGGTQDKTSVRLMTDRDAFGAMGEMLRRDPQAKFVVHGER